MIAMRIEITTPVVVPKMIAIGDVSDTAPGRLLFVGITVPGRLLFVGITISGRLLFVGDTVPGRLLFVGDTVAVVFPEKVTIHSSVVSLKNRLSPILICMKKNVYNIITIDKD